MTQDFVFSEKTVDPASAVAAYSVPESMVQYEDAEKFLDGAVSDIRYVESESMRA